METFGLEESEALEGWEKELYEYQKQQKSSHKALEVRQKANKTPYMIV